MFSHLRIGFGMTILLQEQTPVFPMNCHPDRSVAQWRDLLFLVYTLKPCEGAFWPPPQGQVYIPLEPEALSG